MDVNSDDDSSWDLIPLSTPHRKRSSSNKSGHAADQGFVATPRKKIKLSIEGASEDALPEMQNSDNDEQSLHSPLPIKKSKLTSIQSTPTIPLKRAAQLWPKEQAIPKTEDGSFRNS
jgi:hypothetical protein